VPVGYAPAAGVYCNWAVMRTLCAAGVGFRVELRVVTVATWAAAGSAAAASMSARRFAPRHAKEPILVDFFMGSPFCCRLLRNVCAAIRTAPGASLRR